MHFKGYQINILLFSPEVSHPQNAGNRKRIYNFGKYLQSQGHAIHFVYFAQSAYVQESLGLMQNEWDSFTLIERSKYCEPSTKGYDLDAWYQDDIRDVVNDMIETLDIQVLLVNYLMQSKLLEYVPEHVLKIIDTHDIFANRHKLYEDMGIFSYSWYSISKEDEEKGLNRADVVLAIQKREADYFSDITNATNTKIRVVGHIEEKHFCERNYKTLKKIGFVGSHNEINEHAITKFLDCYLESELLHNVDIVIAGNICNKIKREHSNLKLRGVVEDLGAFYEEVDLIINPLLFGTGLKIKTLEALSYGVPVVSTQTGFEGIESTEPSHQLNTIDEMLSCIKSIHKHPKKLEKLAKFSREIFKSYEQNVKKEIASIFDTEIKSEHTSTDSKKQKETIVRLYRQLQVSMIENKAEKKRNELQIKGLHEHTKKLTTKVLMKEKELQTLLQAVEEVVLFSIKKHPMEKYRAYKAMLKTFFGLKRKYIKRKAS